MGNDSTTAAALLRAIELGAPAHRVISGRELRYTLTLMLLDSGRTWSVQGLVEELHRRGLAVSQPESKTVCGALRWEVTRGRVVRLGWGRYRTGRIPRSTVWFLRQALRETSAEAVASNVDPGAWSGP